MAPPSDRSSEDDDHDARGQRLQKVLARAGIASRRHAEELIASGHVTVNGQVVRELGTRVSPGSDRVAVDGQDIQILPDATYIALHKPLGYISTAEDPQGRPTVMSLVPPVPGLFAVGRLDAESEGLLLFTTDGGWAQRVTHPRYGCTKEYVAIVDGVPNDSQIAALRRPLQIGPGEWTAGAEVDLLDVEGRQSEIRLVLYEGRNRQIRRMFAALDFDVLRLIRTRVGAVELGRLKPGTWRDLSPREIKETVVTVIASPSPRRKGGTGPARRRSA